MKRLLAVLALVPVLAPVALVSGCGGGGSDGGSSSGSDITVFAAASLTDAFTKLQADFQQAHPGTTVHLQFGGSSDLVSQLQNGAPADVFASADTTTMAQLTASALQASDPKAFASNTLEIAVPPGNPAGITSFADLAKPGTQVVVCAPEVPCGAATAKVEQASGITLQPVSEEQSVTDVLGKVSSGEADAGLVYVTDVKGSDGAVQGVTFPQAKDAVNIYPITTLKDAPDPTLAAQFVDLVLSSQGQQVLADDGFAPAP